MQSNPKETKPDEYKLGIWVRDNVQGLGTITFMTRDGALERWGMGFMIWIQARFCRFGRGLFIRPVFIRFKRDRTEFRGVWKE